jgi:hypothetical protein
MRTKDHLSILALLALLALTGLSRCGPPQLLPHATIGILVSDSDTQTAEVSRLAVRAIEYAVGERNQGHDTNQPEIQIQELDWQGLQLALSAGDPLPTAIIAPVPWKPDAHLELPPDLPVVLCGPHGPGEPPPLDMGEAVFTVVPMPDRQTQLAASLITRQRGVFRIALLYEDTPYGQELAQGFTTHLPEGLEVVFQANVSPELSAAGLASVLQEAGNAGAEALYDASPSLNNDQLTPLVRQSPLGLVVVSVESVLASEMSRYLADVDYVLPTGESVRENTGFLSFAEGYAQRYGGEVSLVETRAYQSACILLAAIENAGTLEGESIVAQLGTGELSTPWGPAHFDAQHVLLQTVHRVRTYALSFAPPRPDGSPSLWIAIDGP